MVDGISLHSPVEGSRRDRTPARGHLFELVTHLAHRRLESEHRFTLLGWLWPLLRQLAQLLVLVVVFSAVLKLGIKDFAVFVFAGLIAWTWFSTALNTATVSLLADRHLVFSARLPNIVLPLVAVAVTLMDLLLALPVLLVMLAIEGRLSWTILLLPVILAVEFALIAGIALATSALNVYFRDIQNIVNVALLLLFYLTPVFYGFKNVPENYRFLLHANPLTALLQAVRAVTFEGTLPAWKDLAVICPLAAVAVVTGILVFRRLEPDFVDHL